MSKCMQIGTAAEIIKDRFIFATYSSRPASSKQCHFFTIDDEYTYDSFYNDFGPYNLAVLYRSFRKFRRKLRSRSLSAKKIVLYTRSLARKRANAAYLIGSFAVIYLHKTAAEVWESLRIAEPPYFLSFIDAALGPITYKLNLENVLRGVQKAVELKLLDFERFGLFEYEHFERIENGDFNWIIPRKILAFCGPHNKAHFFDGYPRHCPESYFPYFTENNVTTVIRLNSKVYNSMRFVRAGFQHLDLFFVDGSLPSNDIIRRFIRAVEDAPGAVAVHCKAGLGRTGTLIACYMMYKYKISAPECISWVRICRPGSVIGPQQQFLVEKQHWCWKLDVACSSSSSSSSSCSCPSPSNEPNFAVGGVKSESKRNLRKNDSKEQPSKRYRSVDVVAEDLECSQGDELLAAKARTKRRVSSRGTGSFKPLSSKRSKRHGSRARYVRGESRKRALTRSSVRRSSRGRSYSMQILGKAKSSCSRTVVSRRSRKSVVKTMRSKRLTITCESEHYVKQGRQKQTRYCESKSLVKKTWSELYRNGKAIPP